MVSFTVETVLHYINGFILTLECLRQIFYSLNLSPIWIFQSSSHLITKRSCRWKKVVNHKNYEWQKDDTCNWNIIWVSKCCTLAIWNFWFWRDEGITTTRHIAACTTTALLQKAKLSFEYTGRVLRDHQQEKCFIKM